MENIIKIRTDRYGHQTENNMLDYFERKLFDVLPEIAANVLMLQDKQGELHVYYKTNPKKIHTLKIKSLWKVLTGNINTRNFVVAQYKCLV